MMEQKNEQPRLTDILGEVINEVCETRCIYYHDAETYKGKENEERLERMCAECPFTVKL